MAGSKPLSGTLSFGRARPVARALPFLTIKVLP